MSRPGHVTRWLESPERQHPPEPGQHGESRDVRFRTGTAQEAQVADRFRQQVRTLQARSH